MKVISILLAFLNSIFGALLILSCISASETLGWITTKTAAGILALYFGILTFKDAVQPISQSRMLLNALIIVILGVSIFVWAMHLAMSDTKNTILLFSGSLFVQGLTSILGMSQLE